MTDARQLALAYAGGRLAFGVVALVAPGILHAWIGEVARGPGTRVMGRAFAARDAALGLGTLLALRQGTPARRWLQMGAAVDAVDMAVSLAGARYLGPRRALPAAALGMAGAAAGGWAAGRVR